ncbi:MAG: DUF421 domain-containing protein [Anaerolineae bacterium]|nr:DUF421 domain-containing protein [Anaerolineae bacterium]
MLFQSMSEIVRTLLVGTLAYAGLILLVRISGKRSLSKMSAFDLVVTVALGSILATILLNEDVALAEGMTAVGLLLFLQYAITYLAVRSKTVASLVRAEPTMVFYEGEFLYDTMKRERLIVDEIEAAIRKSGTPLLKKVQAVILETDGSLSVLAQTHEQPTVLNDIRNFPTPSESKRRDEATNIKID